MEQTTTSAPNNGAPASNGMATASLILGIVSLVFCFVAYLSIPCGILAIIFAVLAKKKIKNNPEANYGGGGAATGGMITGILGLLVALIIVIIAIMFVSAVVGAAGSQEFQDAMNELSRGLDTLNMN